MPVTRSNEPVIATSKPTTKKASKRKNIELEEGTINTLLMIKAGWSIKQNKNDLGVEWRCPGRSGVWYSDTLDFPPEEAVKLAQNYGHISVKEEEEKKDD